MSAPPKDPAKRDGDIRGVLTVLLGAMIVVLLIVANVQLAGGVGDGSASSNGGAAPIAPPVQGTSNDVLAEELRQLSGDLSKPINLLRTKLGPLSGLAAGQLTLAGSFGDVASSVRRLGSVRSELTQLSSGLGDVVGNTKAMAGSLNQSTTTLQGVGRGTAGMTKEMRRVNRSIKTTGKETSVSMVRMSEGIEAMRKSFDGISQSLAATSSGTQEMRAALIELNSNMKEFLKTFCTLLSSEPECAAGSSGQTATP